MAKPLHPDAGTLSSISEVKCWTMWGCSGLKMSLYTKNSVLCESFHAVSSIMFFSLGLHN